MQWKPHKAVKAGRMIAGQTQEGLAASLREITGDDWTRDKVASLEAGRKTFSVDILMAVSEAQGLRFDFYLTGANSAMGDWLSSFLAPAA